MCKKGRLVGVTVSLFALILAMTIAGAMLSCDGPPGGEEYFQAQSKAILASIAYDFQMKFHGYTSGEGQPEEWLPAYVITNLVGNFDSDPFEYPYKIIAQDLSDNYNIRLKRENSRFEAYDEITGNNMNIYDRKNWETIKTLVAECNQWIDAEGKLACEFDGGNDYGMKPYTALLFIASYLNYQSQHLGYRDGHYLLVTENEPHVVLEVDQLLSRNALARIICYKLLARGSSLLVRRFETAGSAGNIEDIHQPEESYWRWDWEADGFGWFPLDYAYLNGYYVGKLGRWNGFSMEGCKTAITFSASSFEAINTETGERITFPRDDDLLNEVLKELNYYKEKCDFVNYFQIENYPMFLLAILRLYDVNLELDEATNKYVLAPGPTDPERFFNIVAEFTFVNNPSDTKYLKEHLTSWLTPQDRELSLEQK